MKKQTLQKYCDQIISQLEKAVQAAVYSKHLKNNEDSETEVAKETARQTKNSYFQTIRTLYHPKDLPSIYNEVYHSAISKSKGTMCSDSSNGYSSSTEIYEINAGRIIRQLNDDFLPNECRDSWVCYGKPHLNFMGKITSKPVGAPHYKIYWSDGSQETLEEKILYLDIMKDGLFYAVLDPDNYIKTEKISFHSILSMSLEQFHSSEDVLIYAEVEVDSRHIHLKNTIPFSVVTEEDQSCLDLQEQCTAIIDRLIDAVYAEIYRKYLPDNIDAPLRENAETDAHSRYEFYIRTVRKLYGLHPLPKKFEDIYQDAIKFASFSTIWGTLRHPIKVGSILSQLNNDFVLKNKESGIKWLVYNKPYLNFLGCTITQPIGSGVYEPIDFIKQADGLAYRVRNPNGDIQIGKLSLDHILSHLSNKGHIESLDNAIYVETTKIKEPAIVCCCSFIMHILSHPIIQIAASTLLVIGAVLALSGIAPGVGAGISMVGGGVLIAGFFSSRTQKKEILASDFFAPNKAPQEPNHFEAGDDNNSMRLRLTFR